MAGRPSLEAHAELQQQLAALQQAYAQLQANHTDLLAQQQASSCPEHAAATAAATAAAVAQAQEQRGEAQRQQLDAAQQQFAELQRQHDELQQAHAGLLGGRAHEAATARSPAPAPLEDAFPAAAASRQGTLLAVRAYDDDSDTDADSQSEAGSEADGAHRRVQELELIVEGLRSQLAAAHEQHAQREAEWASSRRALQVHRSVLLSSAEEILQRLEEAELMQPPCSSVSVTASGAQCASGSNALRGSWRALGSMVHQDQGQRGDAPLQGAEEEVGSTGNSPARHARRGPGETDGGSAAGGATAGSSRDGSASRRPAGSHSGTGTAVACSSDSCQPLLASPVSWLRSQSAPAAATAATPSSVAVEPAPAAAAGTGHDSPATSSAARAPVPRLALRPSLSCSASGAASSSSNNSSRQHPPLPPLQCSPRLESTPRSGGRHSRAAAAGGMTGSSGSGAVPWVSLTPWLPPGTVGVSHWRPRPLTPRYALEQSPASGATDSRVRTNPLFEADCAGNGSPSVSGGSPGSGTGSIGTSPAATATAAGTGQQQWNNRPPAAAACCDALRSSVTSFGFGFGSAPRPLGTSNAVNASGSTARPRRPAADGMPSAPQVHAAAGVGDSSPGAPGSAVSPASGSTDAAASARLNGSPGRAAAGSQAAAARTFGSPVTFGRLQPRMLACSPPDSADKEQAPALQPRQQGLGPAWPSNGAGAGISGVVPASGTSTPTPGLTPQAARSRNANSRIPQYWGSSGAKASPGKVASQQQQRGATALQALHNNSPHQALGGLSPLSAASAQAGGSDLLRRLEQQQRLADGAEQLAQELELRLQVRKRVRASACRCTPMLTCPRVHLCSWA